MQSQGLGSRWAIRYTGKHVRVDLGSASLFSNTPTQEHLIAAKGQSCLQAKAVAALVHRSAPCPAALMAASDLCFASTL